MKPKKNAMARVKPLARVLGFLKEGWFWILLPTIIVGLVLLILLIFADPYQRGMLHAKFILLYSIVGG